MEESLLLSIVSQGWRIYLCAVSYGVPLYFKHNDLLRIPGYQLLWWGPPSQVTEGDAAKWVARHEQASAQYQNYEQAASAPSLATAVESFQSAVRQLGRTLEYAPGVVPQEVLVGALPA